MDIGSTLRQGRIHYGWVVLATGTLVVVGALGLARFGYSLVLPSMQVGLGMDNTQAGVLATSDLIGYLSLSLVGGALASRFGPRVVVTTGLILAGAGMLFTGLVDGFLTAAWWRFVTGIGSGASNVPVMGLMAAWFAARRRGLAMGIAVAGSSVALIIIGPLVPRLLTTYGESGWRICWYVFGGTTIAIAFVAWLLLRNGPDDVGLRPLGALEGETAPGRSSAGLQWGLVYRSPAVWHLGLVYVAFGFSYIIFMTFFTKRLVSEGGYSTQAAGNLFMTMGWFSLLCGLLWGAVSDSIGRKATLMIVYLIQATSFALFALSSTPTGFTIAVILFGLTAWSIPAIMAAACGDVLGPRMAPAALGFITVFFGIGQATGPSVAGAVADATGRLAPAYLLAAAVAMLGAVGTLFFRSAPSEPPLIPS